MRERYLFHRLARQSCPKTDGRMACRWQRSFHFAEPSKKPCNLKLCHILKPRAERWPSGRRRSPAKGVYRKRYRGFESLPLRQLVSIDCIVFSGASAL